MSTTTPANSMSGYMVGDTVYSLADPERAGRVTEIPATDDKAHQGLLRIRWSDEVGGDPDGYWQNTIGLEPSQR